MLGASGEPGHSPYVKFTSSLDSPSPRALTLLQVPDIRAWMSLGDILLPATSTWLAPSFLALWTFLLRAKPPRTSLSRRSRVILSVGFGDRQTRGRLNSVFCELSRWCWTCDRR